MKWCKLGELIEDVGLRCGDNTSRQVYGVNVNKEFIPTVANLVETDISKYLQVPPKAFACNLMHIGRDERLPLAFNTAGSTLTVTSAYYVFQCSNNDVLPEYLYIVLNSKEIDRYTWFLTDSSVRGNLKVSRFKDISVPLPTLAEQREAVSAWQGLRKLKTENEQLAEPLMTLCRSAIEGMKRDWPMVELGDLVERSDDRNLDKRLGVESVRGISNEKKVIETKADMTGVPLAGYKLFRPEEFCFVTVTSRNGGKISLACNLDAATYLVSSTYEVFRIKEVGKLLPRFLYLWTCRPEFDRYARFNSWGSARESFNYADMCRVKIPLTPVEVQQSIVDIYRAAAEAKRIAAEADELSRKICPALIQKVVRG